MTPLTWTPAQIGCYWSSGPYTIHTRSINGMPTHPYNGFVVSRNRAEIGTYPFLLAAKEAAEKHYKEVTQ